MDTSTYSLVFAPFAKLPGILMSAAANPRPSRGNHWVTSRSAARRTPSPNHPAPAARGICLSFLLAAVSLFPAASPVSALPNKVEGRITGPSFFLSYERPHPLPPGFQYIVEASSDLVAWSESGLVTESSNIDNGTETVTIRDGVSVGAANAKRFMRLRVVESPAVTAPQSVAAPGLTGSTEVGQTLSATTGTWNDGGEAPAYTYQWLRNGVPIDGATAATYQTVAADVGATLAVRVTATNSGGSTNAVSAGFGPVVAPVAALAIRPDGWTAEVTFDGLTTGGTYALAPDTANPALKMTVVSPGFDANGSPTTFQREIIATVPLRQPYPNNTAKTETAVSGGVKVTLALSDRIYAGDTVATCTLLQGAYTSNATPSPAGFASRTNGSTLAYPKAVGGWADIQYERATGTSHDVEFLAFHRYPREGRQVACVEFIATDESGNSTTVKSSEMVASNRVTGGNPVAVYRASIPLAGLLQGQHIKVRTKSYPFLGDSTAILDSDPTADGAAMPTPNLTNLVFLNDKTGGYGTVYAYVSPTGDNGTAVASTNAATAAAAPFATIQAAAAKIQTANNSGFGHNDPGGGVIRLVTGTYAGFGASMGSLPAGKTWLTIESAPGHDPLAVMFTTGSQKRTASLVKFRNMLLKPTVAATSADHIILDGQLDTAAVTVPNIMAAWENVELVGVDSSLFETPISTNQPNFYRIGLRYFLNCRFKNVFSNPTSAYGGTCTNTPLLAGCTMDKTSTTSNGWSPHLAIGNILRDGNQLGDVAGPETPSITAPNNLIVAFNTTYEQVNEASYCNARPTTRGAAFVQNLFERIGTTSGVAFGVGRDGSVQPLNNIIMQYISTTGGRTNFLYNDTGTEAVPKNGDIRYSILYQFNIKTDTFSNPTFGPNGNRIGNWEPVHGVGFRGNLYTNPAANGPSAPYYSSTSWNGSYTGLAIKIAQPPAFVNDQGYTAGNGGNGDYRLTSASAALNLVPIGLSALPFDLSGVPRRNDGTGAAGAFEYVP